ncbi:hypothetical protein AXI59_10375 [Bacillus nakamurai]|uniref:Uncharacterized protein n=1 Tax=Bacillus nakamurai TaxID=1793963 RepID=A0A150F8H3_9BACI|nr:hypothetical protein [Bacillus nakamurai]KXZ18454.1 hypothetical protein AXI58_16715 [Bacillus nakamurai]KXZ23124.1 hypothetical protein AXI59_10375 [Bacillus nakamurai]MCC9023556.1 hypothetical protein [Bacillus nakamurai]MCP6680997.1 hypothetical protein [Bacillus nakamurai]MED1229516.1 hypothetical protein [Bacillus nakamurai]
MYEILTNPLVIAVVIGIISAIFGKKSKDEKQSAKNPAPQAQQQPTQQQPADQHKLEEVPVVSEENPFEQKRREAEKRLAETKRTFKGLERELTAVRGRNASLKKNVLKVNKDTAVQGVIFGEVFGPPRAKKPHRTMQSIRKN